MLTISPQNRCQSQHPSVPHYPISRKKMHQIFRLKGTKIHDESYNASIWYAFCHTTEILGDYVCKSKRSFGYLSFSAFRISTLPRFIFFPLIPKISTTFLELIVSQSRPTAYIAETSILRTSRNKIFWQNIFSVSRLKINRNTVAEEEITGRVRRGVNRWGAGKKSFWLSRGLILIMT